MGLNTSRTYATTPTPATWLLDSKDQKDVEGDEEEKPKYPKSVIFIMGNEFCERFSYYGMRAVLTLYLKNVLLFEESMATVIYHAFTMVCYFTPLFGAILSDTKLGKFRTIFYLSILYAIGSVVLAGAAVPTWSLPHLALSMVGLALIAFGTGGIKPCVAAFGGDQFADSQEKQRQQFFSIFYFSINAGSLISTFVTPILRADVKCFDQENCFAAAFGLPAILMVVAVIFFVAGKPLYKIVPPQGNMVVDVVKCMSHAVSNRYKLNEKRDHWVDYADDKYDKKLLEDIKAVLRVLFMYLPLPVFWALFDQQGSRWTLQATRMDGYVSFLDWTVKPDQIMVVNPMMILAMIPIFEVAVYPLFAKCHILTKPLQRIGIGGLLAAASFVVAGFVQLAIEGTYPVVPSEGKADLSLYNMMPCGLSVSFHDDKSYEVPPLTNLTVTALDAKTYNGMASFSCGGRDGSGGSGEIEISLLQGVVSTLALGIETDGSILKNYGKESRKKAKDGKSDLRLVYNIHPDDFVGMNFSVKLSPTKGEKPFHFELFEGAAFNSTEYQLVDPDTYTIQFTSDKISDGFLDATVKVELGQGAAYTLLLSIDREQVNSTLITDVAPNSLSMFLQIPQYLIITLGEIMFSITGLEFSYSQAPASMKSVLQAAWLLTVAFGNLIVVIIAELELFEKQSYEFFLFAGLMAVDMVIFIIMSLFYVYVKSPSELADEEADAAAMDPKALKEKEAGLSPSGLANKGFQEDTKF